MTPAQVIRKAIPDADDALCDHILWGRTPFPMGGITARGLYEAARRFQRAAVNGRRLCDWCNNLALTGEFMCVLCATAISQPHPDSIAATELSTSQRQNR